MKNIIRFSLAALIILSALSFYLFYWLPINNSQYQEGQCLKDNQLKVIFKIEKVKKETYQLTVIHSGHYTASPEYAKGTQLEYLKKAIDGSTNYHPSLCEVEDSRQGE